MKDLAKMCLTAIVSLLAVIACCLITSCRSVQYVPVESVRTEIEYRDRLQRDSIHVHDSIHIRDKGDTVFVNRWHTVYKDKQLRDTIYIENTDSVQVPYSVEKQLSRWQSIKMVVGGWAFGIIIALVLIITGWFAYRLKGN
ncbi:hypothetical protein [Bacteroides nordii]|jgi:hypothetical protein|uniref:hypothetical protein n=1 Tax=Bacteroides nordii TaxID=291645 RepID=UPI001F48DA6C|nr:hypothetical protein [Bacteroides nordii]MCE8465895.1 hypothetical protein [Bacteroides nordii]UYU49805.1 hypothetical protein KQP55_04120 [Bacteroides nordii]DAZ20199.1 MAG TPA: Integrin beta-2 [Caudoviricetes sp.]